MTTIKEKFESYDRGVIPKTAGKEQRQETERAFYGGALAVFELIMHVHNENDISAISNELKAFVDSILDEKRANNER